MRRRHADVDHDELRLVLANEPEKLLRLTGLTDDLEVGTLEQAREALAQQDVVVRDDDTSLRIRK
jgi:hypothetical protein